MPEATGITNDAAARATAGATASTAATSKVAVLIPCYNEALTIGKVVDDFARELPEAEIFVYDNNLSRRALIDTNILLDAAMAERPEHAHALLFLDEIAFGEIDGLVVTARHGDNHYKYAKPYIDSGIPMFIDKPITIDEAEAVTFMRALKAKNVRISGGSSLKQDVFVRQLKQEAEQEIDGIVG